MRQPSSRTPTPVRVGYRVPAVLRVVAAGVGEVLPRPWLLRWIRLRCRGHLVRVLHSPARFRG